jgi:hypothetical protein
VNITNSGLADLHISSIAPSGANAGDFATATNTCSSLLVPNASCALSVVFSPTGDGLRAGSIVLAADAPNSPQSIALTGTGSGPTVTRPSVTITPQPLSFASITVGTTSASQNIALTSSGSAALHISSVVLGESNPGDFVTQTNGCTAAGYAPGASCAIALTFTPTAAGQLAATLTITDDAPNSPQSVSLVASAPPALLRP